MKRLLTTLFLLFILYKLAKEQQLNIFLSKAIDSAFSLTLGLNLNNGSKSKGGLTSASEDKKEPEFTGNILEKSVSRIFYNALSTDEGRRFLQKSLNLPGSDIIQMDDEVIEISNGNFLNNLFQLRTIHGSGVSQALCGHKVKIDYKIHGNNREIIKSGVVETILGREEIIPMLDAVVVGMKIGDMRQAKIPLHYFNYSKTPKFLDVNIKLLDIRSSFFIDDTVRISDDSISYSIPLLCASPKKAAFHLRITVLKKDGRILYDSSKGRMKLSMHLGDQSYPLFLSHVLHNKTPVGVRTVIAQGKFLAPFEKWKDIIGEQIIEINKGDYYMLEFFDFDKEESSTLYQE